MQLDLIADRHHHPINKQLLTRRSSPAWRSSYSTTGQISTFSHVHFIAATLHTWQSQRQANKHGQQRSPTKHLLSHLHIHISTVFSDVQRLQRSLTVCCSLSMTLLTVLTARLQNDASSHRRHAWSATWKLCLRAIAPEPCRVGQTVPQCLHRLSSPCRSWASAKR